MRVDWLSLNYSHFDYDKHIIGIDFINNFNMEALKNIPRVLDGVEDVRNESIEDIFKEYKRNVKIFV